MAKIITDPKNLERDQVVRPSLSQLEEVAKITFELAVDMSRHVREDKWLSDTSYYRNFISSCLESMSNKLFALKRLGPVYIAEACAILRVHTEITVDFFWLAAHYRHKKTDADLLSKQFFLFRNKKYLAQAGPAGQALLQDPFLRPFVSKESLEEEIESAREKIRGVSIKGDWRVASEITKPSDCMWGARCKRAARQVEEIANLKFAPFLQNLQMLNSYSHWDSIQIQQYEEDFREALFCRDLNIAIGFLHDVMTGTCFLSDLELPEKAFIERQKFIYMET